MNYLKRKIDRELTLYRNRSQSQQLRSLQPHESNIFKHVNKITKTKQHIPPLKNNDGTRVFHPQEKAEAISECFAAIHSQNDMMGDPATTRLVMSTISDFNDNNQPSMEVPVPTIDEVRDVIRSMKAKKSTRRGWDHCFSCEIYEYEWHHLPYGIYNGNVQIGLFSICLENC